jgi:hypothetical protein
MTIKCRLIQETFKAIQFDGKNYDEVIAFMPDRIYRPGNVDPYSEVLPKYLNVCMQKGTVMLPKFSWVVIEFRGWPVVYTPDTFAEKYLKIID